MVFLLYRRAIIAASQALLPTSGTGCEAASHITRNTTSHQALRAHMKEPVAWASARALGWWRARPPRELFWCAGGQRRGHHGNALLATDVRADRGAKDRAAKDRAEA